MNLHKLEPNTYITKRIQSLYEGFLEAKILSHNIDKKLIS